MHILFGWSKKYSTSSNSPIKSTATSPNDPLFATLSDDYISVYYTDHRGYRLFSKIQVQPGGTHIVWKPDSSAIAVAGPGSQIRIYSISLSELKSNRNYHHHHYHHNRNNSTRISLIRTVDCMYGTINCITADGDYIMVGTTIGYLLVLIWNETQVIQALTSDVITRSRHSSSRGWKGADTETPFKQNTLQNYNNDKNKNVEENKTKEVENGIEKDQEESSHNSIEEREKISFLSQEKHHSENDNNDAIIDIHFCQTIGVCGVVLADGRVSFMFLLNQRKRVPKDIDDSNLENSNHNQNNNNNNNNSNQHQNKNNHNQSKAKRYHRHYKNENNENNNDHSTLRKSNDLLTFIDFDVHLVQDLNACSISINPVGSLAALGCKSGKIVLFRIFDGNHIEQIQWLRSGDEDPEGGHKGSALVSFSRDGTAIAVGYSAKGMAVFNVAGGERIISASKHRPVTFTAFENILPRGVRALDWETSDEGIVLTGTDANTFIHLPLLRWIDSGEGRCTLLGRDRLLLFQPPTACLANLEWQHVPLPETYLASNYPIRYVATSPNGRYYAAAGKRGFAVYTLLKDRWRVFGVEKQEQAIHPLGLAWIDNKYIAVIDETPNHGCGMLVFPRDHLDVSSLIGSFNLPHVELPIKMTYTSTSLPSHVASTSSRGENGVSASASSHDSASELQLVIYDASGVLHMMFVRVNEEGNALVEPFKRISTNMPFKKLPLRLATACIEEQYSEEWQHLALILGPDHILRAVSFDTHREQILCRGTSYFWIERIPETPHEFLLFTSAPHQGLTLNLVEFRGDAIEMKVICVIAENDYEVIPFGCDKSSGIFVCASMGTVITPAPPFTLFEMHTKMYPYAHRVLYRLLSCGMEREARAVASRLSIHPSFRQVLEWLLHHVVQDSKHPQKDIPKVIDFIYKYSFFYDVVVSCLRKTDLSYWDHIFHAVGSSVSIFEQCLRHRHLHEAAYMLQVVRNTNGLHRAFEAATSLLVPVLSDMEYDLANDLIRFISGTELELMEQHHERESSMSSSKDKNLTTSEQNEEKEKEKEIEKEEFDHQKDKTEIKHNNTNNNNNSNNDNNNDNNNNKENENHSNEQRKENESIENNENDNNNNNENIKKGKQKIKDETVNDLGIPRKQLITSMQNLPFDDYPNQALDIHWVDIIVTRHARQLLSQFHLFQLAFMARAVQFEIVEWLRMENHRSARIVPGDWKFAFDRLHTDLDLPRTWERTPAAWHHSQKSDDQETEDSNADENRLYSISTHPFRTVFTPAQHRLYRISQAVEDLRWLETQLLTAQCYEWVLLVASLLCDVDLAADAFVRVSEEIRNAFRDTMRLPENSCYKKFARSVFARCN